MRIADYEPGESPSPADDSPFFLLFLVRIPQWKAPEYRRGAANEMLNRIPSLRDCSAAGSNESQSLT